VTITNQIKKKKIKKSKKLRKNKKKFKTSTMAARGARRDDDGQVLVSGVQQLQRLFETSEKSIRDDIRRVASGTRESRSALANASRETTLAPIGSTSPLVNARAVRVLVWSQRQAALALPRLFVQHFWPVALRLLRTDDAEPKTTDALIVSVPRRTHDNDGGDDDVDDKVVDYNRTSPSSRTAPTKTTTTTTVAVESSPSISPSMICLQAVFAMLQALIKTCRVLDPAFEDTLFRLLGDAVRSLRCGSLSRSIVTKHFWHITDYQTPLSIGLTLCVELVADRPAAARPAAIHIMLGLALATGLLETIVDVCDRLVTCDQSLAVPAAVRDELLGDFAAKIASVLPLWKRAYVPLTPHPSGDNVPPIAIAAFVLAQLALLADQLVVDPSPVDRFEEGAHSFDVAVRLVVSLSGASFGSLLRLVERVVDAEHLRRVVEAAAGSTSDSLGDEFAPPHTAPDEFVAMRVSVLHSTMRLMRLHVALVAAVPTRERLAPALLEKLRGVARGVFERRVLPRGVASDDAVVGGELSLSAALLLASAAPLLYDTPATRSRLLQTLLANVTDGKGGDESGARSALVERLMEQFADPQRLAPLVDSGLDVSLLASRVTAVVVTRAVKQLDGAPAVARERADADKDAATTTTAVASATVIADTTVATTVVPPAVDSSPATAAATTATAAAAAVPVVIFDGPRHSKTYGGLSLIAYDSEGLVDIVSDCKWTASSSLASRRPQVVADASRATFWQSNDSSPHTLRAVFKTPAQVAVVSIMNNDDLSFTPRTISVSLIGADGSKIAERTQVRVRHESTSAGWFDVPFQGNLPPASSIAIDFVNQRSGGVDVRVHLCAVFVYPFAVPSGGGASATADKVDWSQVIEHPPAPSNMLLMSLAVCCASKRASASAPLLASELAACVVVVERAAAIVAGVPSAQLLHLVLRLVRGSIVGVVVPAQILAFGDSLMATSDADTECVEAPLRRLAVALEPLIAIVRATTTAEPAAKALKAAQTRCPAEHVCEMAGAVER
jgi:hypothetical protein